MFTDTIVGLTGRYHLGLLAIAGAATAVVRPSWLSGVLLGGAVMALNFASARWLGARALRRGRLHAGHVALAAGKLVLVLGVVAAIMLLARPDFFAFAAGMASFFVALPCALAHAHLAAPRQLVR